ncbi:hypothetical protein ABZ070_09490 [Streptomyces sp. NPDC006283]|uniref:hypothetical protein n=1 Tax=Streptomyces sp. NPDC006283 TaxID=3156741 RepID=UPI0033BCE4F2
MTTTPSPATQASDRVTKRRRRILALIVGGALTVLLLPVIALWGLGMADGPVLSETEFREHLRHTEEAGEDAVRRLGLDPSSVVDGRETAGVSCKDDLGVDPEGVVRDQPTVTWKPDFESRAAYTAAVDTLRREWSAQGLTVEDIPARAADEPGAGLPGVRATDDHGVALSLRPGWYSDEPELVADGGCVRHRGHLVEWE